MIQKSSLVFFAGKPWPRDENKAVNEERVCLFRDDICADRIRYDWNPLLNFCDSVHVHMRTAFRVDDSLRLRSGVASVWATGAIPASSSMFPS